MADEQAFPGNDALVEKLAARYADAEGLIVPATQVHHAYIEGTIGTSAGHCCKSWNASDPVHLSNCHSATIVLDAKLRDRCLLCGGDPNETVTSLRLDRDSWRCLAVDLRRELEALLAERAADG